MRVTVLGLGIMGQAMARNIAAAGLPLTVWNRSEEKAAALSDVATVAGSVAEAVEGAGVVVTMLYDAASVLSVMDEARGHLASGAVWVQMSTIGVDGSDQVVALAESLGVTLVDAPVLGSRKPAEDGALVVLASGPSSAQSAAQPVLDAVGSRTMWVGEAGAGSRLKLAANHWVITLTEGIADSLALARGLDLDPQHFLDAVKGGAMDAPYVQLKGGMMLAESTVDDGAEPDFALDGMLKDADLVLAAASAAGVDLGALPGARAHLARAVEAGHGERDFSATWLAH